MTVVKRTNKTITFAALAALTFILLAPASTRAQWTTSGNDISNTNTGNVGVGTASPASKLDVNGTAAVSGDLTVAGGRLKFSFSGPEGYVQGATERLSFWTTNGSGGQAVRMRFGGNAATSTAEFLNVNSVMLGAGIKFALGTTSPEGIFDARGGVAASGNGLPIILSAQQGAASGGAGGNVIINSGPNGPSSSNGSIIFGIGGAITSGALTSNERMRITDTGRVGIGTSSPGAALDVRGSIALDGTVPTAHAATNYSSLWLKNNVALIPEVAAGYSILNIGTNYQRSGGNWTYVDQTIPTWVLSMGGGPSWDQFQVTRSSNNPYNMVKLLVVNSAGDMGVGVSSPAYKLDVNGNVNGTGLCIGGVCKTNWSQVGGQWGTSGTSIYYNGGNVGIGTTTPSTRFVVSAAPGAEVRVDKGPLDVSPAITALSSPGSTTTGTASGITAGSVGSALLFSDNANFSIAKDTKANFVNNTLGNGTVLMTVTPTGRIGVGTSAPATILHVQTTGATKPQFILQNTTATTQIETSVSGNSAQWNYGMDQADSNKFKFSTDGGGNLATGTMLTMTTGGAVGIGTATPAAKLDVSGGYMHVSGVCGGALPNTQGAYLSWNQTCGTGETNLINHQGQGTGGFAFMNTANGSTLTTLMSISGTGDVTVLGAINAKYQDVAEWVPSTQKLSAGTVVVLDAEKTNHVVASMSAYDTKVAGVVSGRPGIALGEGGDGKMLVATTGRVKVRVDATRAPIRVGDLLVTSDAEGVAMKSVEVDLGGVKIHRPGTIIGKALEPLASGTGEILVLLSLQ